jgi:putative transposase
MLGVCPEQKVGTELEVRLVTMPIRSTRGYDNVVVHVMNRATQGVTLFQTSEEYATYIRTLEQGIAKFAMRVLAYSVMPNHVHLLLWPTHAEQLSRFMQWLTATHARRWHRSRGSSGRGAVYQGRFRAVPVHDVPSLFRTARYIERNPVRAKFVDHTEDWKWSSAASDRHGRVQLAEWPVPRGAGWRQYTNDEEPAGDLDEIRTCLAFNRPIGPETITLAGTARVEPSDSGDSASTEESSGAR